jgi:hypothetical protein
MIRPPAELGPPHKLPRRVQRSWRRSIRIRCRSIRSTISLFPAIRVHTS